MIRPPVSTTVDSLNFVNTNDYLCRYQKLFFFSLEGTFAQNALHMSHSTTALTKAILMKTLIMTTIMASHLDGAVFIQIVGKGEGLASLVVTVYDGLKIND